MIKFRPSYIPIEESTRQALKNAKREKTYDQFINEIIKIKNRI